MLNASEMVVVESKGTWRNQRKPFAFRWQCGDWRHKRSIQVHPDSATMPVLRLFIHHALCDAHMTIQDFIQQDLYADASVQVWVPKPLS